MTQERLSRRQREERAGDELAERLDRLSRPLAERVLGRAIELDAVAEAEAEAAANTMDYETLKSVALEVGITEDALKRALLEELDTDLDHNVGVVGRLTIPDAVRGGLIVSGETTEVLARLQEHLATRTGSGDELSQGRRSIWAAAPRVPPLRATAVSQREPARQLVEIDVATALVRRGAWRWIIAILVLGTLFGSPVGGLLVLGIWVAGMVAVVGSLKRIGRRARRSINRALQAASGGDEGSPQSWLDVWEETSP